MSGQERVGAGAAAPAGPLVRALRLSKDFPAPGRGKPPVRAVSEVTFDVQDGEVLGIVGESGSGKTTLVRCLLGLIKPTSGTIEFAGNDVTEMSGPERRRSRRDLQVVFQDPVGSLDPRLSVKDLVAEPLRTHEPDVAIDESRILPLLEEVGLDRIHLSRKAHELSGGQCQRVAIARALALRPRVVVLDEPTSSLDVSVQAQILNLLSDLRHRHGLTYVLVSHDLTVVRHVTDRVAVMYLGRIVEMAPTEDLFERPRHPYTRALLSAAPSVDRGAGAVLARGELPRDGQPEHGCPFRSRCWLRGQLGDPDVCDRLVPPLTEGAGAHHAACHFPEHVMDPIKEAIP